MKNALNIFLSGERGFPHAGRSSLRDRVIPTERERGRQRHKMSIRWAEDEAGPSSPEPNRRRFYFILKKSFKSVADGSSNPVTQVFRLLPLLRSTSRSLSLADDLFLDLRHFLLYSLVVGERDEAVDRTMRFAARLCCADGGSGDRPLRGAAASTRTGCGSGDGENERFENPLLRRMLRFICENHDVDDHVVRSRLCQMAGLLLESLPDGHTLEEEDDLLDDLTSKLLRRLNDRIPGVRVQAAAALERLQDPSDPECPVASAFSFHLSCDPSPELRRALLPLVAVTPGVVGAIARRVNDAHESVRRRAFEVLVDAVPFKALTTNQRIFVLKSGIEDVDSVKSVVERRLLPKWLVDCDGDWIKFLKSLPLEEESSLIEEAFVSLLRTRESEEEIKSLVSKFHRRFLNGNSCIPFELLSPESAFYWRHLSSLLSSHAHELSHEFRRPFRFKSSTDFNEFRISPTQSQFRIPQGISHDSGGEDFPAKPFSSHFVGALSPSSSTTSSSSFSTPSHSHSFSRDVEKKTCVRCCLGPSSFASHSTDPFVSRPLIAEDVDRTASIEKTEASSHKTESSAESSAAAAAAGPAAGDRESIVDLLPSNPSDFLSYIKDVFDHLSWNLTTTTTTPASTSSPQSPSRLNPFDVKSTEKRNEEKSSSSSSSSSSFIFRQLIQMLSVYDWSLFPEYRSVAKDSLSLLASSSSLPLSLLPPLLLQWRRLLDPTTEIAAVAEIIADVQPDDAAADAAAAAVDAADAAATSSVVSPLSPKDEERLTRALSLLADTLENTPDSFADNEKFHPTLQEMIPSLVLPGVACRSPAVRAVAVRCLGLLSLYSLRCARQHFNLFFQALMLDTSEVKIEASKTITDCLLVFGLSSFVDAEIVLPQGFVGAKTTTMTSAESDRDEGFLSGLEMEHEENIKYIRKRRPTKKKADSLLENARLISALEEEPETLEPYLQILVSFLENENPTIDKIVSLGIMKLFLAERTTSLRLLTLLLKRHLTLSDGECRSRFEIFVERMSSAGGEKQELLLKASVRLLAQSVASKSSNPESRERLAQLSSLIARSISRSDDEDVPSVRLVPRLHDELAIFVCAKLLKDPKGIWSEAFLPLLDFLQPSSQSAVMEHCRDILTDPAAGENVRKILARFAGKMKDRRRDGDEKDLDETNEDVRNDSSAIHEDHNKDTIFRIAEKKNTKSTREDKSKRGKTKEVKKRVVAKKASLKTANSKDATSRAATSRRAPSKSRKLSKEAMKKSAESKLKKIELTERKTKREKTKDKIDETKIMKKRKEEIRPKKRSKSTESRSAPRRGDLKRRNEAASTVTLPFHLERSTGKRAWRPPSRLMDCDLGKLGSVVVDAGKKTKLDPVLRKGRR